MAMLVTGGRGFIGSNLLSKVSGKSFDLVDGQDVKFYRDIERQSHHFIDNTIVHLAADPGVAESIHNPGASFDNNVSGTFNVLEAAKKFNARVILASSAAVDSLTSPYGASKKCGEVYAEAYKNAYGLSYCALRFSNVYGPGSTHKTSVIANMIKSAKSEGVVRVYGDGRQTRDFIHVDDVVDAIIRASQSKYDGVLYVGSGVQTSILDVANLIASELHAVVVHKEERAGDVRSANCDTMLTKYVLHLPDVRPLFWNPSLNLKEGIINTVRWFNEID